ncbi:MAG: ribonuclease PH [Verrucomicrobiota bacterium]
MNRPDGRQTDQLRPVNFVPGIAPHASGSVLVSFGNTRVICSCFVEEGVPRWMKEQKVGGGWMTAEYSMLPYSTTSRKARDIARGKIDGRSSEIQRLIGRSLRAAVDLSLLEGQTAWVDCDVLQADGGTRTASITGATVACEMAFRNLIKAGRLTESPLKRLVSAISVGIYEGEAVLDLNYIEDRDASVDMNVVMTAGGEFVEVQGTGEEATFTRAQMESMLALAEKGIREIGEMQTAAIEQVENPDAEKEFADLSGFFNA